MSAKVKTNHVKGSVAQVEHKRKVRLLLWGGASTPSDNFTFENAKNNVLRDYKNADKNNFELIIKRLLVAKDIITAINAQDPDSIRSLDVWTHGGPQALYLTTADPPPPKNASWTSRALYQTGRWGFHNSSLYRTKTRMILNAAGWTEGSALVNDIDFSKFTVNAKIEFHGCKTAENPKDEDNIAADFSARLSSAGKTQSSVIGHIENAQPLIKGQKKGETSATEQDYRYGKRAIFKNGKLLKTTDQRGAISESELEK